MNKIGFIGAGKMATAIIKGSIDSKFCNSKDILVSDVNEDALKKMQSDLNITPAKSNNDIVKNSDIVFFAVKPFVLKDVLSGVQEDFLDDKFLLIDTNTLQSIEQTQHNFDINIYKEFQ